MATETSKGRGTQSIKRIFLNDQGDPSGRAQEDTHTIVLQIPKIGQEVRCELKDVFNGQLPSPCVGRAAAAFGVSTSLGNAGNSAIANAADAIYDGEDREARKEALEQVNPEVALSAVKDRWEILTSGEWAAEREFGPGTSLLLEAVREYRRQNGKESTEADIARYRETFKNKEEVKNYMSSAKFRAVYEKMKMERALSKVQDKPDASDSLLQ